MKWTGSHLLLAVIETVIHGIGQNLHMADMTIHQAMGIVGVDEVNTLHQGTQKIGVPATRMQITPNLGMTGRSITSKAILHQTIRILRGARAQWLLTSHGAEHMSLGGPKKIESRVTRNTAMSPMTTNLLKEAAQDGIEIRNKNAEDIIIKVTQVGTLDAGGRNGMKLADGMNHTESATQTTMKTGHGSRDLLGSAQPGIRTRKIRMVTGITTNSPRVAKSNPNRSKNATGEMTIVI